MLVNRGRTVQFRCITTAEQRLVLRTPDHQVARQPNRYRRTVATLELSFDKGVSATMSSQANIMPLAQPTPVALFVTFWHHATLFAHLATLAAAAFSVGCGFMSLEMARWGLNVLAGAAQEAAK